MKRLCAYPYGIIPCTVFLPVKRDRCVFQPNVPCTDNVAFDMERLSRSQPASRRSALGDFANDSSLSLEPLRTSGMSQLPQDGELTPRSGEINIAVTSKFALASITVLWLSWDGSLALLSSVLQGCDKRSSCRNRGELGVPGHSKPKAACSSASTSIINRVSI